MALFRRKSRAAPQPADSRAAPQPADLTDGSPWGERPAWMQDGIRVVLLVGYETLEVVGESNYQDNLRALTGYRPQKSMSKRKSAPYWWPKITTPTTRTP